MSNWNGWILTAKGRALEAKVTAGQTKLTLKNILLGDGVPTNLANATALTHLVATLPVTTLSVVDEFVVCAEGSMTNADLTGDFTVREMGITARDTDGTDILYGITYDDTPDVIPAAGGSVAYEQTVRVNLTVTNTANVELSIGSSAFVTRSALENGDVVPAEAEHAATASSATTATTASSCTGNAATATTAKILRCDNPIIINNDAVDWDTLTGDTMYMICGSNMTTEKDVELHRPYGCWKYGVLKIQKSIAGNAQINSAGYVISQTYISHFMRDTTIYYRDRFEHNEWTDWQPIAENSGTPIGDVVFRPYLKQGYIKANGAQVNRADYPRLVKYATDNNLWTTNQTNEPWKFGTGNGSTTMLVPNYIGQFVEGGNAAGKIGAGLPNIIGALPSLLIYGSDIERAKETYPGDGIYYTNNGCIEMLLWGNSWETPNVKDYSTPGRRMGDGSIRVNASSQNPIYGASNTVQPPAITLIPQIKY